MSSKGKRNTLRLLGFRHVERKVHERRGYYLAGDDYDHVNDVNNSIDCGNYLDSVYNDLKK